MDHFGLRCSSVLGKKKEAPLPQHLPRRHSRSSLGLKQARRKFVPRCTLGILLDKQHRLKAEQRFAKKTQLADSFQRTCTVQSLHIAVKPLQCVSSLKCLASKKLELRIPSLESTFTSGQGSTSPSFFINKSLF